MNKVQEIKLRYEIKEEQEMGALLRAIAPAMEKRHAERRRREAAMERAGFRMYRNGARLRVL